MSEKLDPAQVRANKFSLYLILGIPTLGILLTTCYYFYLVNNAVEVDTFNSGQLITPPKKIIDIPLRNEKSQSNYDWLAKEDRWTFLVVGGSSCEEACLEQLYLIRQIRAAMGKYQFRLDNTYLNIEGDLGPETKTMFKQEYPQLQLLSTSNKSQALDWFSKEEPKLDLVAGAQFYVVDPHGWVMMYYGEDNDYKQVIRDMKFLLKNN